MSRLPDGCVDLVVTSPPYNLGVRYRKYSDRLDRKSYLQWCRKWAAQVGRILESSGSFFLNIGAAPSNPMLPHEIAIELRDVFVLQNTIHWIKSIAIDTTDGRTSAPNPHLNPLSAPPGRDPSPDAKRQARVDGGIKTYGHFKPISSKRFVNDCHEYVFHFTKSGRVDSTGLRLAFRIRTKATSRAGRTRGEPTVAAAVTPGLFPTKRSKIGRKNDRIPRLFRSNWLNGASICTVCLACKRCLIRFWGSEIPPFLRSAAA